MHDPQTVAFDIKSPFRRKPDSFWPKGYRPTLITIWHVDPEDHRGKCGTRGDDSCGWFTPPFSPEDRDRMHKLAAQQYGQIFEKQRAIAEGKEYFRICFVPSVYDAIYWSWRAIKYHESKRHPWQYGRARNALTASELEDIYSLASCPVDNLRLTFSDVKDGETFTKFFMLVYRAWLRHQRPWYKHPRWHFWHWSIQVHPWQTFRRWAFSRCAGCGKRFTWGYSPVSHQWDSPRPKLFRGEVGVYHSECSEMTMKLHKEPTKGAA